MVSERWWRIQADWTIGHSPMASTAEAIGPCTQATARKAADQFLARIRHTNPRAVGLAVTVTPGVPGSYSWERDVKTPAFRRTGAQDPDQIRPCPPETYRSNMARLRSIQTDIHKMPLCTEQEAIELVGELIDRWGEPKGDAAIEAIKDLRRRRRRFATQAIGTVAGTTALSWPGWDAIVAAYTDARNTWTQTQLKQPSNEKEPVT